MAEIKQIYEDLIKQFSTKNMETKIYKTAKEFFKFLNNYEADILEYEAVGLMI